MLEINKTYLLQKKNGAQSIVSEPELVDLILDRKTREEILNWHQLSDIIAETSL